MHERFDVMGNLKNFLVFEWITKQGLWSCLVHAKNLTTYAWKYRWKQKLIVQFACKSRDESFKPSYSIFK